MSTTDDDLLGWSPMDAASRAIQAFFGLGLFLLASGNNDELINNFAKDTLSSLEIVGTGSDSENIQRYLGTRNMFYEMFDKTSFDLFIKKNERIWQLFMERFNLRTCQLRMNLIDMHECINIPMLARSMKREERYLYQLPLSAEIVI